MLLTNLFENIRISCNLTPSFCLRERESSFYIIGIKCNTTRYCKQNYSHSFTIKHLPFPRVILSIVDNRGHSSGILTKIIICITRGKGRCLIVNECE